MTSDLEALHAARDAELEAWERYRAAMPNGELMEAYRAAQAVTDAARVAVYGEAAR